MKQALCSSLRHRFVGLGLAFLAAGAVQAQASPQGESSGFYGEIGYTGLTYKEPEVMGLLSAKDSKLEFFGQTFKVKIDNIWGAFLKPKVAVTPEVELFGRLGYARSQRSVSVDALSFSESGNSVAYGVGASYAINKRVSLNFDYMSYYNRDNIRIQGPTLGLGIKF